MDGIGNQTKRHKRDVFLPFCKPTIEDEEINEVVDSLKSGWITTGPKTLLFEKMFCEHLGCAHAVAVNSATAGWHIVAHALDIGVGDEVIVPAITWASVPNVVELLGATPVFADVDKDTLQVDPMEVERLITPRTRAVIPVHYAGAPVDLDSIKHIISGKNITLVEDSAHALGTKYKGKAIGADSTISIFSFHPIKNITTGEGGMVVCQDEKFAERLRLLRFHGVSKDAWRRYRKGGTPQYEIVEPGYKYNMLDLQAAIGLQQLQKLDRFNQKRAYLAEYYNTLLESIPELSPLVPVPYPFKHAWHLFVVRLEIEKLIIDRNMFMEQLTKENIGSGFHFPTLHLQEYYREKYGYRETDLPNAVDASSRIISLPMYPGLNEDQLYDVVVAIKAVIYRNLKKSAIGQTT